MDLSEFADAVESAFGPLLQGYGFSLQSRQVERCFCTVTYVNEPRYVQIKANMHPVDHPSYFNVVLGEGKTESPEGDWNAVALWHMKKLVSPSEQAGSYYFSDIDDDPFIEDEELVIRSCADLEKFHGGFLTNDLKLFRQVRVQQNRDREPYKIYTPDSTGRYTVADDTESADLKNRFSTE